LSPYFFNAEPMLRWHPCVVQYPFPRYRGEMHIDRLPQWVAVENNIMLYTRVRADSATGVDAQATISQPFSPLTHTAVN
jgi:hypothetical protein